MRISDWSSDVCSSDLTLYMCLGQQDAADLRTPLRASQDDAPLEAAIHAAIARKPKGHDFVIDRRRSTPAVPRHMSKTGGRSEEPRVAKESSSTRRSRWSPDHENIHTHPCDTQMHTNYK